MSKDLTVLFSNLPVSANETFDSIIEAMPEHASMLQKIQENLPEVHRASSLFMKTQSQFMDNVLTVSHTTPLRNMHQILAQMVQARDALKSAVFKHKKQQVNLKIKQRQLETEVDELKKELIAIEIAEEMSGIQDSEGYIAATIRKLSNYNHQYTSIMEANNLQNFSEKDFEADEERYHIMKAFDQGTCAARSRNGMIDEGNLIYIGQLGINGASAQKDVASYLIFEQELLIAGKEVTHKMYLDFLSRMADKYKGSATNYQAVKGMSGTAHIESMAKQGDLRLLKSPKESA